MSNSAAGFKETEGRPEVRIGDRPESEPERLLTQP